MTNDKGLQYRIINMDASARYLATVMAARDSAIVIDYGQDWCRLPMLDSSCVCRFSVSQAERMLHGHTRQLLSPSPPHVHREQTPPAAPAPSDPKQPEVMEDGEITEGSKGPRRRRRTPLKTRLPQVAVPRGARSRNN